jgi:uncharacterized membrane protein
MLNTLIVFVSGIITVAVLDYIWIGTLFGNFYKTQIGSLARTVAGKFQPNLIAGAAVYVLMSLGISIFVLPRIGGAGLLKAFCSGALWGLVLGGVYELTNYSMLGDWSFKLVLLDMFWTMLSGGISTIVLLAISRAL